MGKSMNFVNNFPGRPTHRYKTPAEPWRGTLDLRGLAEAYIIRAVIFEGESPLGDLYRGEIFRRRRRSPAPEENNPAGFVAY